MDNLDNPNRLSQYTGMRVTLRQLEIFRAICLHNSVTAASSTIGLSQAAASQGLAELENLLERKLFDRLGKKLILNSEGKQLLPAAVEILDRVGEMERPSSTLVHYFTLGASLTVGSYMLPESIARFCKEHPDFSIQLQIRNTEQIVAGLLQFEFDAGWVEGVAQHPDLNAERWAEDELVIIASPNHRLAGRRALAKELNSETWVLREKGSGTREVFERAVYGKLAINRIIEVSGLEGVKRVVAAGGGISCVSIAAAATELKGRRLSQIRVAELDLRREITLLIHKRKHIQKHLSEFLEHARRSRLTSAAPFMRKRSVHP
jgi:DNA-binding transcriptional LysR family regulator